MGDGCLEVQNWTKISFISKVHPRTGDKSQSWEPGAHCTAWRQFSKLERVLSQWLWKIFSKQLNWFLLLPCDYTRVDHHLSFSPLKVFFAVQLLCVGEEFSAFIAYSGRNEVYRIWSFSGTSWTYFELFTFLIKEFPSGMRCFSLEANCQTTLHVPMIIHFKYQRMNEQSKFSLAVISWIPNEWFSSSSI